MHIIIATTRQINAKYGATSSADNFVTVLC